MSDTYEQPDDDELDPDIPGGDDADDDVPQGPLDHEDDEDEDDLEISFEGEAAEEPDLVRHLRATIKTQAEELKGRPARAEPVVEVGERPTLESCGFDEDEFADATEKWLDRKRQASEQSARQEAAAKESANVITSDLNESLTRFGVARTALKVPNFDAAEAAVNAAFSANQVACLMQAIEGDAAKVIYALGRTPSKLAELAAIKNPVKFTAAVARLEGKVTVKPKKAAIEPDEPIRGSARMTKSVDKEEQKLEEKAAKSGDRTQLLAYRRAKKEREASRSKR